MVRPNPSASLIAWAAIMSGAVGVGLVTVLVLIGLRALTNDGSPAAPETTPLSKSYGSPPQEQVDVVHAALHTIGSRCAQRTNPGGRAQDELAKNVDTIVLFARRYPNSRFPIDDESGTALSLLFATRDELRVCSPRQAARINQVMPAEFRDKVS